MRFALLPAGDQGTRVTLDRMRVLVRESYCLPAVRQLAASIAGMTSHAVGGAQIDAVCRYVGDVVLFVRDPVGVEWIYHPASMLAAVAREGYVHGDCDDIAVLTATMGMAVGYPARFVAVAFASDAPMSHVWAELLDSATGWTVCDPSRELQPLGALTIARRIVMEV